MPERAFQEEHHGAHHDYRDGSPHLRHTHLYDGFLGGLAQTLDGVRTAGLAPTVLEVGAGDGAFVQPLLAFGADVTATEMSRHSIDTLEQRYGRNASFQAHIDPKGTLDALGDRRFSIILYASVLHHIPDYAAALDHAIANHLEPGGALVSIQDPLWYPSLPRGVRKFSDAAYLGWRLRKGEFRRGVASRLRRMRGTMSDDQPSDMVEYHVVRDGVDQDRIVNALRDRFDTVRLEEYWSTQSPFLQRLGERMGVRNTFAIWAAGHRPGSSR